MKVKIEGPCLKKGFGRLAISPSAKLTLYYHPNSCRPMKVELDVNNINVKNHLVALGKNIAVVEHLFSALYGLELFNVQIEFFSNEVPFFDGSSLAFVKALSKIKEKNAVRFLRTKKEIRVKQGDSFIHYMPRAKDKLIIEMELCHPYIKTQKIAIAINKTTYCAEIAPARTFVFTRDTDPRLKNLPPYGIGITKHKIYCTTPLRFKDELVRHKALDLLGDLYVLQHRLAGKIICKNTSHNLNLKFVRKLSGLAY